MTCDDQNPHLLVSSPGTYQKVSLCPLQILSPTPLPPPETKVGVCRDWHRPLLTTGLLDGTPVSRTERVDVGHGVPGPLRLVKGRPLRRRGTHSDAYHSPTSGSWVPPPTSCLGEV